MAGLPGGGGGGGGAAGGLELLHDGVAGREGRWDGLFFYNNLEVSRVRPFPPSRLVLPH